MKSTERSLENTDHRLKMTVRVKFILGDGLRLTDFNMLRRDCARLRVSHHNFHQKWTVRLKSYRINCPIVDAQPYFGIPCLIHPDSHKSEICLCARRAGQGIPKHHIKSKRYLKFWLGWSQHG